MTELARKLEDLGDADITAALDELGFDAFLIDGEGIIRWQNQASLARLGEWVGRRWSELIPVKISASQADELDEVWNQFLFSGEPAEFSIDVTEPNGEVARHDVSAAPVRDGKTVVGFFGVAAPRPNAHHPRVPSGHRLTGRELEVLQLLADGKSTSQIAAELYLSKTTVRNHIAHLLAKLGVHTRIQAIVVARRVGLIEMD
jgi:DNA-binding CsgD family transcriptional regulator